MDEEYSFPELSFEEYWQLIMQLQEYGRRVGSAPSLPGLPPRLQSVLESTEGQHRVERWCWGYSTTISNVQRHRSGTSDGFKSEEELRGDAHHILTILTRQLTDDSSQRRCHPRP